MGCQPPDHVFPELYPGYQVDDASVCDCGALSYADYQRALREQRRLDVELRLERERQKRREPEAPGPNPEICTHCRGPMSGAIRSARTGRWMRTCKDCQRSTGTYDTPSGVSQGPVAGASGPMFSSIETVSVAHDRMEKVATQASLFAQKRSRK